MPPRAQAYADSLARRGRAVAVNLLAATQRPTQQAMGGNAVRSQMDVRICLRVRERRDVDLILGQGAHHAGWHAHQLTQPGAFLISDTEHTTPDRARGYLISDNQVTAHSQKHARPALGQARSAERAPANPATAQDGPAPPGHAHDDPDPGAALWNALCSAGPEGVPFVVLAEATGMGRTWIYERLRELAAAGQAVQTTRGHWRAADAA
jgi:S-DNA-T family DNA segregation ATPase FtsK/SpoIIIE